MPTPAYTIGVDFGTNSARAIVVRCHDGAEVGTCVFNYPSGHDGILLDPRDANLARQNPADYLLALEHSIRSALADAQKNDLDFQNSSVIGIGIDTTGSSPIPVDQSNTPLALLPQFRDNLNAQCWLWKDHTSWAEAEEITAKARQSRPHWIARCGNTYSSEWFWSKILHCLRTDPAVFHAAYSWVELSDWLPSVLCGISDPTQIRRGVCAAGHKALYCADLGGLPDKEFLASLDPALAQLRDRLYQTAYDASQPAGNLSPSWAKKLALTPGIPVAIGELDVHYGAIGSGIAEGILVKVLGTSTCDCAVLPANRPIPEIPGICGIVHGAILPGFFGVEAGQSAVGDIFRWWVECVCQGNSALHAQLTAEAEKLKPGQSGLLALDWNNGNRNILVDQRLTGLLLGQTLHTSRAEIYRALIEATAFGARAILERLQQFGVQTHTIVCAGGIADKNPMLMQIYADVTNNQMRIARSNQACALGAAIAASVIAGTAAGGHPDFPTAQAAMTGLKPVTYTPNPQAHAIYNEIYQLYLAVHDAFGGVNRNADLSLVMKKLLDIKDRQSS